MKTKPRLHSLGLIGAGIGRSANDGMSPMDVSILCGFALCAEEVFELSYGAPPDIVNLWHGRDFLGETHTYDAVAVFSVLHIDALAATPRPTSNAALDLLARCSEEWWRQVSTEHTLERWRTRLASTGAQLLYIAHHIKRSLDGDALGEIPGYTKLRPPGDYGDVATAYLRD